MTITLVVTREIEVEVTLEYHRGMKGHRDKYGAPEEPDDPESWEILSTKPQPLLEKDFELTKGEEEEAIQQAKEECGD
jgi:hypothetical protein